jgi:hypothetical protein
VSYLFIAVIWINHHYLMRLVGPPTLRSMWILAMFTTAMLVAFAAPRLGFGLICGALILHLRPGARASRR